jgi:hypothetical protein
MSNNYKPALDRYGGGWDYSSLQPHAASVAPDWGGSLYAPVNFQPAPNTYAGVNVGSYSGKDAAQKQWADVINAQYADYERRFQPLEDMALGLLTERGTKDLPLELDRTRQTVGGVFGSIQGQQERAMERFGQTNTARPIAGSLAETTGMVGGLNRATFSDEDRRMRVLGGGTGAAAQAVRGGQ